MAYIYRAGPRSWGTIRLVVNPVCSHERFSLLGLLYMGVHDFWLLS